MLRTEQVQVTLVVVLLIVLSVGTGAVVATVTARRLAEPLRDVADRAARLGAGDFRRTPDRHGIPELDRVSDVLDTSAGALAELVQRERNLVGDVSHQLRSRLTALQLRLDELTTHPDPDVDERRTRRWSRPSGSPGSSTSCWKPPALPAPPAPSPPTCARSWPPSSRSGSRGCAPPAVPSRCAFPSGCSSA